MKSSAHQPELFRRADYKIDKSQLGARLAMEHNDRSWRYACWLNRSKPRRDRELAEVIYRQRLKCWRCGLILRRSSMAIHHMAYTHVYDEDPGDIVLVHSWCHRLLHERPDLHVAA